MTTVPPGGYLHNGRATFQRVGQGRKTRRGLAPPLFFARISWPHALAFWAGGSLSSGAEKESVEVVLGNAAVVAAVLKKEASERRGDHAVLIPLRMVLQEAAHALEQHLGHLGFKSHARWCPFGINAGSCGAVRAGRKVLLARIALRRQPQIHAHGVLTHPCLRPTTPQEVGRRQRGAPWANPAWLPLRLAAAERGAGGPPQPGGPGASVSQSCQGEDGQFPCFPRSAAAGCPDRRHLWKTRAWMAENKNQMGKARNNQKN